MGTHFLCSSAATCYIRYPVSRNHFPYSAGVARKLLPAWLALDRETRNRKAAALYGRVAQHPNVRFRWFDADALSGQYSDFAICEFAQLHEYHALCGALRDDEFFFHSYVEIRQVMVGLKDGFKRYEESLGATHLP